MLREYFTQDIFTSLILVCLLLLVIARHLFPNRFRDFIAVIYNLKYLKLYVRERKKFDIFNALLFANFILMAGVFCFLAVKNLSIQTLKLHTTLVFFIFVLTAIFLTKSIFERVVGHFFEFSEFIKTYLFYKNTFKYIIGLVLLFINTLLLFSSLDKKYTIYVAFGLIFLINLNGFIRFLRLYQKAIIRNFFYFLLYLCALEIGPYVILYKVFKDYFG